MVSGGALAPEESSALARFLVWALALLGDSVDDEDVDVAYIEPSVNEDVERFQEEPLKKHFAQHVDAVPARQRAAALHRHELHCAASDRTPGLLCAD